MNNKTDWDEFIESIWIIEDIFQAHIADFEKEFCYGNEFLGYSFSGLNMEFRYVLEDGQHIKGSIELNKLTKFLDKYR